MGRTLQPLSGIVARRLLDIALERLEEEPVIVLQGPRAVGRQEADLHRLLGRFEMLSFDAVTDFDGAVRIYRRCRAAGVTLRGMIDCMIAAVTWRRGATLLSHDADMDRVAHVVGIELDDASLRA